MIPSKDTHCSSDISVAHHHSLRIVLVTCMPTRATVFGPLATQVCFQIPDSLFRLIEDIPNPSP
jgi:hypothetical protein